MLEIFHTFAPVGSVCLRSSTRLPRRDLYDLHDLHTFAECDLNDLRDLENIYLAGSTLSIIR